MRRYRRPVYWRVHLIPFSSSPCQFQALPGKRGCLSLTDVSRCAILPIVTRPWSPGGLRGQTRLKTLTERVGVALAPPPMPGVMLPEKRLFDTVRILAAPELLTAPP